MVRPLALIATCLFVAGCAQLSQLAGPVGMPAPRPPRIAVGGVMLVAHPRPEDVARALCPRVAPVPVCMLLGGPPPRDALLVTFSVGLDVTNDNAIPLPLVEALVAFTAYPGPQAGNNLGAVCLSFCDQGAACPARADACQTGGS